MSGSDARALSRSLLDLCRMRKLTIATAESCTGGLVAGAGGVVVLDQEVNRIRPGQEAARQRRRRALPQRRRPCPPRPQHHLSA